MRVDVHSPPTLLSLGPSPSSPTPLSTPLSLDTSPTALHSVLTAHERVTHLRIAPLSIPCGTGNATVATSSTREDEPTPPEPASLSSLTPPPPHLTTAPSYRLHPLHSHKMSDFEQTCATEVDAIQRFIDERSEEEDGAITHTDSGADSGVE